jgi:hypothetical protein
VSDIFKNNTGNSSIPGQQQCGLTSSFCSKNFFIFLPLVSPKNSRASVINKERGPIVASRLRGNSMNTEKGGAVM